MAAAGANVVKHYRDLAFMGFWEVVKNIGAIRANLQFCKEDIITYRPDILILVDYSGFNLRIAEWASKTGLRVFYYISPQIWASRPKRVFKVKAFVNRMFVVLPFEKDFYKKYGVMVDYVGHPLLDVIKAYHFDKQFLEKYCIQKPIIALLPGSRKQEIKALLPPMLSLIKLFPSYQFVIAAAPSIPLSFYEGLIRKSKPNDEKLMVIANHTYDLLKNAAAAIVTSGTATLETALLGVPQVVCYKSNWFTYQIAKRIITVRYISLVNLIGNQPIVEELIQNDVSTKNLQIALTKILEPLEAQLIRKEYEKIKVLLGNEGASERAAQLMLSYCKNKGDEYYF